MVRKPDPTPEEIREAAYHLWLKANRPEGRAEEFWFEAEALLAKPAPRKKTTRKPAAKSAAKSVSKAAVKKKPAPRKRASKAAEKA